MTGSPPVPALPVPAAGHQGLRAGLITRCAAAAIDAVVVLLLIVGGYVAVNAVLFLVRPSAFQLITPPRALLLTLASVVAAAYLAGGWWIAGRTWGCNVMGLRVVGRHGRPPGLLVAGVRALLCVLVPIGLLWCGISRSRRSLQDWLLGTSVVYDWPSA